ncbi:MAG: DUF4097 family beta strand repeat-containing protein [Clostridia bacterium]
MLNIQNRILVSKDMVKSHLFYQSISLEAQASSNLTKKLYIAGHFSRILVKPSKEVLSITATLKGSANLRRKAKPRLVFTEYDDSLCITELLDSRNATDIALTLEVLIPQKSLDLVSVQGAYADCFVDDLFVKKLSATSITSDIYISNTDAHLIKTSNAHGLTCLSNTSFKEDLQVTSQSGDVELDVKVTGNDARLKVKSVCSDVYICLKGVKAFAHYSVNSKYGEVISKFRKGLGKHLLNLEVASNDSDILVTNPIGHELNN